MEWSFVPNVRRRKGSPRDSFLTNMAINNRKKWRKLLQTYKAPSFCVMKMKSMTWTYLPNMLRLIIWNWNAEIREDINPTFSCQINFFCFAPHRASFLLLSPRDSCCIYIQQFVNFGGRPAVCRTPLLTRKNLSLNFFLMEKKVFRRNAEFERK